MQDKETRCFQPAEMRVDEQEDGPARLVGYAAVYNSRSENLGGFVEVIEPGTFSESVGEDVRALVEHQGGNMTIGRTSAGTLRMREDDAGLWVEIDLPDTTAGRDVRALVERGDLDGMSIGFRAVSDRWAKEDDEHVRYLSKAKLFEVSVVTFPAYQATGVAARSLDDAKAAEMDTMRRDSARRAAADLQSS